jgi:hypothetical protein
MIVAMPFVSKYPLEIQNECLHWLLAVCYFDEVLRNLIRFQCESLAVICVFTYCFMFFKNNYDYIFVFSVISFYFAVSKKQIEELLII